MSAAEQRGGTTHLSLGHFGKPFDEQDVRAVCSIAKSTKDLTSIGRFGLGFKSVFTYSERPEIYSGTESFAIIDYVKPHALPAIEKHPDETIINLPFRHLDESTLHELHSKLKNLRADLLLFLREIDRIEWKDHEGSSGTYSRHVEVSDQLARRVYLYNKSEVKTSLGDFRQWQLDETWLAFSRQVYNSGKPVGHVEIAWMTDTEQENNRETLLAVGRSYLYVYFPTIIDTRLGFLAQGPYRTTSNRDNIPKNEEWNKECIRSTSELLVESLLWLRDHKLLDVKTLSSLPITKAEFADELLEPLFTSTVKAFREQQLVPVHPSGYMPAEQVKIASSDSLKKLISSQQLTEIFEHDKPLFWLAEENSFSLGSEITTFLTNECEIEVIEPSVVVKRLTQEFLGARCA